MDNPYWYSEKHSHVIDLAAIRLNAFHLMNIFLASQPLASEHRLDDPEDNLANSYLAPLRTSPDKVKRYAIKLPDFYWFLSLNQGFRFFTE